MMTAELRDAVLNVHQLGDVLSLDITFAMGLRGSADKSQEARRIYVRSVFALVDGMTHSFKRLALAEHERGSVTFSAAEVAMLRSVTYELSDSGQAVERRKHLRFAPNVKLGLRAFASATAWPHALDFATPGWRALYNGSRIRNRITHPKAPSDLELSAEDLDVVAKGLYWFWAESGRIMAGDQKPA